MRIRLFMQACCLLFAVLIFGGCGGSSSSGTHYATIIAEGRAAVKDVMAETGATALSVALVGNGRVVWSEAFGMAAELDLETLSDLFASVYEMKLEFLPTGMQDSLITSITDRIPGMTPEMLRGQLACVRGLGLSSLAAYASVMPSLPIGYAPLSGLAERLVMLGGTLPAPPDFSLFTPTYGALFQLHYDILLSDLITAQEWRLADNNKPVPSRPLSLSDQYGVMVLAMERTAIIRSRIRGIPKQTSKALIILFQLIFTARG